MLKILIGQSTIYTGESTLNIRSCFNSLELTSLRNVILAILLQFFAGKTN